MDENSAQRTNRQDDDDFFYVCQSCGHEDGPDSFGRYCPACGTDLDELENDLQG